jgi:hypothetical protein
MIFLRLKSYNTPRCYLANSTTLTQSQSQPAYLLNHYRRCHPSRIRRNPTTSINTTRTINSNINERLTSIGGFFGAISIIITGGLLYAIFTTNSNQAQWHYIVAVLVNVSLLILLMIMAILFDRLYLKRLTTTLTMTTRHQHHHQNNLNSNDDMPPLYDVEAIRILPPPPLPPLPPNSLSPITHNVNIDELKVNNQILSTQQPPNYFDLYPSVIYEHVISVSNGEDDVDETRRLLNETTMLNANNSNLRILIQPMAIEAEERGERGKEDQIKCL